MKYKMAVKEEEIRAEIEDETLHKKRHYWIYGPANTGKTTWRKNNIKEDLYEIPFNGDWKNYAGEHNLWIDEFRGCLAPNEINKLCDGGYLLNYKGGSTCCGKNTYVYVFSNFSIDEVYSNALTKNGTALP